MTIIILTMTPLDSFSSSHYYDDGYVFYCCSRPWSDQKCNITCTPFSRPGRAGLSQKAPAFVYCFATSQREALDPKQSCDTPRLVAAHLVLSCSSIEFRGFITLWLKPEKHRFKSRSMGFGLGVGVARLAGSRSKVARRGTEARAVLDMKNKD